MCHCTKTVSSFSSFKIFVKEKNVFHNISLVSHHVVYRYGYYIKRLNIIICKNRSGSK